MYKFKISFEAPTVLCITEKQKGCQYKDQSADKNSKTTLKVGSFSFDCIIILIIDFIHCQKALFTREWVHFSKKLKVLDARDSLTLMRIPVSTTFCSRAIK